MSTQRVAAGSTAVISPIHKARNVPVQFGDTAPLGEGWQRGAGEFKELRVLQAPGMESNAQEINVLCVFKAL